MSQKKYFFPDPKYAKNLAKTYVVQHQARYAELARAVSTYLRVHLDGMKEDGFQYHSIQGREKKPNKLISKLLEYHPEIAGEPHFPDPFGHHEKTALPDLAGVRVVTYYIDDLNRVYDFIKTHFLVQKEVDKTKEALEKQRFGYLGRHFIVSVCKNTFITGKEKFDGMLIEIQTKTILQHAWAEIEHDFYNTRRYGNPNPKFIEQMQRNYQRLAGSLEISDELFTTLKNLNKKKNGNRKINRNA